jgi:hypothetical protein
MWEPEFPLLTVLTKVFEQCTEIKLKKLAEKFKKENLFDTCSLPNIHGWIMNQFLTLFLMGLPFRLVLTAWDHIL